ncbi:AhpC/TSA family protein [Thalassomonas viridans]|uniref:thioredoxin-dependent peroxiredoxin n=1 Tax=Thalassomonas viridans TaxID=137584 RepID=A0AAE9Z2W9_9GAMM|nr:peroxiredoxin-like family protein [Thalassomonas viridans]WDE05079.1 AhpC/TSA family protein [Thalassomonas viridans]
MKLIHKLLTAGLALLFTFAVQAAKPIAEEAGLVTPLLNGQQVPAVMATTVEGKQVNLQDVLVGKKTILFFYRGGWCPFCNTQMGQLKQISSRLKGMGFQLIGISTDAPEGLQASIKERDLDYTLLSDFNSKVSQSFGLAFFASQKTTERYVSKMKLTNPLQKNRQGEERLVLPAPAVYVFDAKGLVQFNYVNPNFRVRLDEELLLKAAELVK